MIVKHWPGVSLVPPSKRQPVMQRCFLACCSWSSGNSRSPVSYSVPCQTSTDVGLSPRSALGPSRQHAPVRSGSIIEVIASRYSWFHDVLWLPSWLAFE